MRITLVNHAYADDVLDPDALLERYSTLTGWSEAVAGAGATVSVAQRFHHDARVVRHGLESVRRGRRGAGAPPLPPRRAVRAQRHRIRLPRGWPSRRPAIAALAATCASSG